MISRLTSWLTRTGLHSMPSRKTAGLIVIGDEILKGSTMDTNSNFICKKLYKLGVSVKRISVVGDSIDDISLEIRKFSDSYDIVFTTGGVGPTHDDKTYLGLAMAFQDEMHVSSEIQTAIQPYLPSDGSNTSFVDKLSTVPRSSELLWGHQKSGKNAMFPVVKLKNVITFPGVPQFCERAFVELQDQLFPPDELSSRFSAKVYTSLDEFAFSDQLTVLADKYAKTVDIGSYPETNNSFFKTKLIVESESMEAGQAVVKDLQNLLKDNVVYFDDRAWINSLQKMNSFRERQLAMDPNYVAKLDEAMKIVDDIVEKYPLDQIALSFNGGKDCTVLLHLLRLKVDQKYGTGKAIQGFHIMCEDQFPEASQFIITVAKQYNITVLEFPGPLKTGLALLKSQRPQVVASIMGSRVSDPHGKYMRSHVQWTDPDWPQVLRVCPILNWSYADVWKTLRGLCVPYCSLYDKGYTSLGGRDSTFPNEKLKTVSKGGKTKYLPAYMLQDGEFERSGRSHI